MTLKDNFISQVSHLYQSPEYDHQAIVQVKQSPQDLHQQSMDALYISILKEILEDPNQNSEDLKDARLSLLWSAVCIQESLTVSSLARLLKLDEQRALSAWGPLQFVLDTPVGTRLITAPPASFLVFIFNQRVCEYACSGPTHHGILAQRCLEVMQAQLRFNIFNLDSSLARDCDIGDLDAKVNTVISEELSYSCLYLGAHLKLSAPTPTLVAYLRGFITHQLLAWLEILNLKHTVNLGVSILSAIEAWLYKNDIASDVVSFVHDARKFVASLAVIPTCSSTPHIYVSLVSTWRPDSPTFRSYGDLIRDLVTVDGVAISYPSLYAYYNPEFLSTHNTSSTSSPRRLATTLSNNAPRSTARGPTDQPGKLLIPLQAKSIRSVIVSADNTSIISASGHLSISRWDRKTGKGISGPFHIRPACFGVVAFSPDAGRIATASSRYEVFVWESDASTEKLVAGPFYGHRSWITAIAISPDGTRIVSGARDQAVLVWNIRGPSDSARLLKGHHGYALSLIFSPNGSHLVSASTDHLVRVWDIQNENTIPQLLQGHTGCVRSVDVSPDGALIVSGADDRTIRIWDMSTGQTIYGPFEGHSDYILSVKFSPNGRQVVSGSQDFTVRVWDVSTGNAVAGPFTAHTSRVNAITFSTDGTQVVSGSDDGTIRVWNVQSQPDANDHIKSTPADSHATDNSESIGTWKLNPDGWVVDKDESLLLWIPPLAHDSIRPPPPDHILIPRFDLPISSLLEGRAWKELCRRQEGKSIRYEI